MSSEIDIAVEGEVSPGFEAVQDAFAGNWNRIEVGASLTVFHGQTKVVDLWGGFRDPGCTLRWERDTLVNVYSTTKGLATIAVAILADRGQLDFEAPVVDYWPAFGARGKGQVTVAQLLSHQAGLCGVTEPLEVEDLYDWDKMVSLLAAQEPLWPPGTAAGYHAITWGYLAGELVRRISGLSLGQYFQQQVAEPLGADVFIGLPDTEMHRVSDLIGPNRARIPPQRSATPSETPPLYRMALENPLVRPYKDASSTAWRRAEIAAANGQANARGIATAYAPMACGGLWQGNRILTEAGIEKVTRREVGDQIDLVTGRPMRRSRGFILNTAGIYGPCDESFGHAGAGGSVGFADPIHRIAFGYAMNQMEPDAAATPRSKLLVDAVYRCLATVEA